MIRRPPRSTLFPTRRSSDLNAQVVTIPAAPPTPTQSAPSQPAPEPQSAPASTPPATPAPPKPGDKRSEEHTSELQSPCNPVCRLLLEKKNHHTLNTRMYCPS